MKIEFSHIVKFDDCQFEKLLSVINHFGEKIMSAISDFAVSQEAFNLQMNDSVVGLVGDIKQLNDEIVKLKDELANVTEEDKLLLDNLSEHSRAISEKLSALDALTPPAVPVE